MKKQVLSFALVATMIASVAAGCSSQKKSSDTDSSMVTKDTTSTMKMDTMKKDTSKMDTVKKPPM